MTELRGLDAWKTDADADAPDDGSTPRAYRCIEAGCLWTGRGSAAYAHHQEAHHRIQLRYGPLQIFACCAGSSGEALRGASQHTAGGIRLEQPSRPDVPAPQKVQVS
jgi:hypothetical protein